MTGVGEQRQRIGGETVPDLADHQREVEHRGDGKGDTELIRRVVVMMMRVVVGVVVRHGFRISVGSEPSALRDEY